MKKKAIISLILVLAMNLLLLKDIFTANALFMIPDEGEPWPQGEPNVCRNFSDTFIDFEDGMNIQLITSQNPGVKFNATERLNWVYGDIRTGSYDVAPYGNQEFVANGNFFGWLGMLGRGGRIDFPQGGATYFSVLVSSSANLFLIAYDADDILLDNVFMYGNSNTGRFTRLTIDAPENKKIAYVVISNFCFGSNDNWIIDDICTDALNVPYFSQCDERWKNERYDHIASTVCRYGCALTSTVMILNYYGKAHGFQTNPKELNEWLKNNSGYDRNGNVKWEVIPEYFKDKYGKKIVSFNGRTNFNSEKEIYSNFRKKTDSILNNDLINQHPVILKVPYSPWHFVVATGKVGKDNINTWAINDPGWKSRKDLFNSYNNNYYGMRRFGPRKKDNSIIVIRICSPVEVLIVDPDGKKLGIDSNGKEYDEILEGGYYIEDSLIKEGKSIKVIEILEPLDGNYTLNVASTGNGPYIIDYDSYDKSGKWTDSETFEGSAVFDNENNLGEIFKYELNYSSQSTGESDSKCFSDSEIAKDNLYEAGALDFSLEPSDLGVIPIGEARNVEVKKNSGLPFEYSIEIETFGDEEFCVDLNLVANLNGNLEYEGGLEQFTVTDLLFGSPENWEFIITDHENNLSGKTCNFEFIFKARQEGLDFSNGFTDKELVSGSIESEGEAPSIPPTPSYGDVIINEVMWMGSSIKSSDEWIELKNTTEFPIDIGQWKIENARSSGKPPLMISANKIISPNSYFLIANYSETSQNSALNVEVDNINASISLQNDYSANGSLILKDKEDNIIDSTSIPVDENWPAGEKGANKRSMERNNNPDSGWHTCFDESCNDIIYWDEEINNYGTPKADNLSQNDPSTNNYEIENETEDFLGKDGNEQDNPSLPVDEEEPITKEIIITKKIILGNDEIILDNGDGDDDDSDENEKDEEKNSFSNSNFVDSVQPQGGY